MNDLHPQMKILKQTRLTELQSQIDAAQTEMKTIRRELGQQQPDEKTAAQQFQAERDAAPSPFKK